jgi:transposase-like protein
MAQKRQYTEDDKATALAALAANGGNIRRTARELNIPATTLRKWQAGTGVNQACAHKGAQKKAELDSLFEQAAQVYLGRALDEGAVAKTPGKDAIIAAATATDKMRLLREQATSIEGHADLTDDQRLDRLRELAERARARRLSLHDSGREAGVG